MSDRRHVRLYIDTALSAGARVPLPEAQNHYAVHVMRLKPGDTLHVFNGRDGEWRATLDAISKKGSQLELTEQLKEQRAEPDVWLAFAPIKKARIDLMVEKATELGASVLWPVFTQHTNAERINLERLRATAIEAAEQCERFTVPDVRDAASFQQFVSQWPQDRRLFVCDETGQGKSIAHVFAEQQVAETASRTCGFLVGPEGGFAQSELDALAQLPFVTRVGLGPRILRAETAALAALVCWQSLVGDWK